MVTHKNVRSTIKKPDIYYDEYNVYIVKNQRKINNNGFTEYEADEIQYDKNEYITKVGQQIGDLTFGVEDGILYVETPDE